MNNLFQTTWREASRGASPMLHRLYRFKAGPECSAAGTHIVSMHRQERPKIWSTTSATSNGF